MIALMAAVAVPATIVGVPIYVGTTARSKLKKLRPRMTKRKRSCLVVLASSVSFILSPLVAALTGRLIYCPKKLKPIFFIQWQSEHQ